MGKKRLTNYTFNSTLKTVTSSDFTDLGGIHLITNVTTQTIIYNPWDSAKGGTLASATLTLEYDTTAMSNSDVLNIQMDDGIVVQPVSDNGGSLTVDGTFWQATQPISGTVTVNSLPAGTSNIGDVDVLTVNGQAPAFGTGVRSASTQRVTVATDDSVPVTGTFWQATQPVSGTVTSNAGTGTFNIQANASVNNAQVGGTAVNTGTGVAGAGTQRVAVASDSSLTANAGTNLNTSALNLETTQTAMSAKLPATLGQKAMSASMAVVIASDQGNLPVILKSSALAADAPTNAQTTAYATNLVVKASAGVLYGFSGYNSRTSSQFIHVYNATALPAEAAVPIVIMNVAAQANFSIDFGPRGKYFSTGMVIGNSSTGPTKTVGAADCWYEAEYV